VSTDLEVAAIFRRHGDAYRAAHKEHMGRIERRAMSAIELCRTVELGGHTEFCTSCSVIRCAYNSCRNRHGPKCQGPARIDWLAARQAQVLPVPYFHVVCTLPAPVAEIAVQNKARVYAIVFKAKVLTLDTHEFIRRVLLHTLPDGFHRIRHYGFLANGHRGAKLALCRALLEALPRDPVAEPASGPASMNLPHHCPCCGGMMLILGTLPRPTPRRSSAQTVRAILAAKATTATLEWVRVRSARSHDPVAVSLLTS
jgi:hypothetical protein